MAESRQNLINGNNDNTEDKVVNVTIPGTDKVVPVKIGKITAAEGCFLAKVVFEEWADAYELERRQREFHRDPKHPEKVEISRVTLQTVANRPVPCYLFDCPFEDYDKGMASERLFKAQKKREQAEKRKADQDHASLDEMKENGYDVASDNNPVEDTVIGNIMVDEVDDLLEKRKTGLKAINKFYEAGYNARQIAEILHMNEWTVRDDIKRIKEVQKKYMTED